MIALSGTIVETIGYAASALVVLSLAMTSVVRLRVISLLGAVTFVVYGALIGSIPIILTNASIAALNVWFLGRELTGRRDLGAVEVERRSPFLVDFLDNHEDRIRKFQPGFEPATDHDYALVLTRDGLPAGVVLGQRDGNTLQIELDYVLEEYRDSRLGDWLYNSGSSVLQKSGFDVVVSEPGNRSHESYLRHLGFVADETRYLKRL